MELVELMSVFFFYFQKADEVGEFCEKIDRKLDKIIDKSQKELEISK